MRGELSVGCPDSLDGAVLRGVERLHGPACHLPVPNSRSRLSQHGYPFDVVAFIRLTIYNKESLVIRLSVWDLYRVNESNLTFRFINVL